MIIREFTMDDLPEMISIWNEIVEEGNAFPLSDNLRSNLPHNPLFLRDSK